MLTIWFVPIVTMVIVVSVLAGLIVSYWMAWPLIQFILHDWDGEI